MTRFLRTASTRRLLGVIAGLVAAIAAGTAIAVAASGSGPVPPAKPLATAVHDALAGPKVDGISARIQFTNHLIDASNMQGSDPILQGASGRLWLSNDHRLRLELQADNGDAQVVVNNGQWWIYDPTSNTVYEGTLPADKPHSGTSGAAGASGAGKVPSLATIKQEIAKLAQHLTLSGAIPGDVAGQPAYSVRISPKHDGGLIGAAKIAWDAVRGVPLSIGIYASHSSSPVLQLKATDISYGPVSASDFNVSPPSGAKVVKVASPAPQQAAAASRTFRRAAHAKPVSGAAAVAGRVPFTLAAPRSLAGLPRKSVTLLDWDKSPAALAFYGKGIGGIAVIEQRAAPGSAGPNAGSKQNGPTSLPTVSIDGTSAQELDTALGTVISFTRGGVSYTVLGSVPPYAAELAARGL